MILKRDIPCRWREVKPDYRTLSRWSKDDSKYNLSGDGKITFSVIVALWVYRTALRR